MKGGLFSRHGFSFFFVVTDGLLKTAKKVKGRSNKSKMADWLKAVSKRHGDGGFGRDGLGLGAFGVWCPGFGRENPLTGYSGVVKNFSHEHCNAVD